MRSRLLLAAASLLVIASCNGAQQKRRAVREYISATWEKTLRYHPEDTPDSLLGLPRPYTVPCDEGMFNELYYWDTFFTNEGLIADGRIGMARDNTEDILYLIDKYGFMPNGNRIWYLSRSQPPFAALMVDAVFDATADTAFVRRAYPTLEKEYAFWQQQRSTPTGLNRYGGEPDEKLLKEMVGTLGKRLGDDFRSKGWSQEQTERFSRHGVAECESGWDFNPRFDRRCEDFCPVDLNALLYGMESRMARFSEIIGRGEEALWQERAQKRKELIIKYLYSNGAFYDYDWVNGRSSDVVSVAPFVLLFTGALDEDKAQAVVNSLSALEYPAGLAVCADAAYPYKYQWSFPNCWPPLQYMAVKGLDRYGRRDDARRLAASWTTAVENLFARTGKLWEKTTCTDSGVPEGVEYGTPSMMGWTAGTYVCLSKYLHNE